MKILVFLESGKTSPALEESNSERNPRISKQSHKKRIIERVCSKRKREERREKARVMLSREAVGSATSATEMKVNEA